MSIYGVVVSGWLPKSDPETNVAIKEVFSLKAVRINLQYLDQLKRLFVDRLH